jgi:hypothetical protein
MAEPLKRENRKLSLYPLDFETALTAALQVEPPSKEKKELTPPKERRPRKKKQPD